jgi:hypothetical protein
VRLVRAARAGAVAALARRGGGALVVLDVGRRRGGVAGGARAARDAELEQVPLLILPPAGAPRGVAHALDLGVVAFAAKLGSAALAGRARRRVRPAPARPPAPRPDQDDAAAPPHPRRGPGGHVGARPRRRTRAGPSTCWWSTTTPTRGA